MSFGALWNRLWQWDAKLRNDVKKLTVLFSKNSASKAFQEKKVADRNTEKKSPNQKKYSAVQKTGLVIGPLLFGAIALFLHPEGMSQEAGTMLGLIAWIAAWWVTEAVPIPITSLLPLILFPIAGVMEMGDVSSSYGDPLIFLFAGSFMIALTMERWNLHRRIALTIISAIGSSPNMIVLGFMSATAFLSMFISNTATTMMMVPISLAVTKHVAESLKSEQIDTSPGNFPFGTAIMLGTAYAATVGGFGTIIGAPANTILVATVNNLYGIEISFARWIVFGLPLVLFLIPLIWIYLVKIAYPMKVKKIPGGREIIRQELKALGGMRFEERIVLTVFLLTGTAWITRSFVLENIIPGINDTVIALIGAFVLFLIPAKNKEGNVLNWETVLKLPWGILWLFGGGLALASGITATGLDVWIGSQLVNFDNVPLIVTVGLIVAVITMLTEFTSNTATSTMVYPIVAAGAAALGADPIVLMIAACMGATFAFMFPVAAPPNAIVFATGYIKMSKMALTGIWLNLFGILFSVLIIYLLVPLIFGGLM